MLMPAIERYRSDRIRSVYEMAQSAGVDFLIFSGKYGMLRPDEPVPYYDHLLQPDDLPAMILKISGPIGRYDSATLFMKSGPDVAKYAEAVQTAADRVAVPFEIRMWVPEERD